MAGNELTHPQPHAVEHADHAEEHGPIYAPDQLKPTPFKRLIRLAAAVTILALPTMALFGNHQGNVEKYWLIGIAAVMLLVSIVAWFLKKAGLRN